MSFVDHRKTLSRKAFVPPGWFIILTVLVCVGAAGWLGWLVVDGDPDDSSPTAAATTSTPSPAATTPEATETAEPTETTSAPEPTETNPPPARREAAVAVLNNTGIRGLATTFSAKVRDAGWAPGGVGNWRGSVPANTVYFPARLKSQATLLADDVDIDRVLPSIATMGTDRLTIILAGPQQ